MNQAPNPSRAAPTRLGVRISLTVALLIAAGCTYALISRPRPALTFTETLLPDCVETHYAVVQDQLHVTRYGKTIARVPASPGLLAAMRNPVIGALGNRYEEPGMWDGIHVMFRFASGRTIKEIKIENRYVPALSGILDECNRLLPTTAQSHLNSSLISRRQRLEDFAARMRTNSSFRPEIRVQQLEELHKAASELPEPSTTTAGTEPSPPKSGD